MVKVSISLPNNTQITLETEESEVLHEVVGMALRDLPRDLMQPSTDSNDSEQNGSAKKGINVTAVVSDGVETGAPNDHVLTIPSSTRTRRAPDTNPNHSSRSASADPPADAIASLRVEDHPAQVGRDFTVFCKASNPLGDMRRVVVAAEGAARYFGADGVTSWDLEILFDLAGWRRPGNFTQTLRNAARAKFGWLERIPGRAGRYAATDLGRAATQAS